MRPRDRKECVRGVCRWRGRPSRRDDPPRCLPPIRNRRYVAPSDFQRAEGGCAFDDDVAVGEFATGIIAGFIGALIGRPETERLAGSLAAAVVAYERGAAMVRVHDVRATREALALAAGVGPVLTWTEDKD